MAVGTVAVFALVANACGSEDNAKDDPFSDPAAPPSSEYEGPLFQMSVDYPTGGAPDLGTTPWQDAIGSEEIDVDNAESYVEALKAQIEPDMATLLFDFEEWDASSAGWYNQPWLSTIRDGIHGTYIGSEFPAAMFPKSGLRAPMTTHVLVYYDEQAAYSLGSVWDEAGDPSLSSREGQFAEGAIIVKPAFTTANPSTWPPMADGFSWTLWGSPTSAEESTGTDRELIDTTLFQFDIIVKDTQSSPESQWVFSTLVYDKDADGTVWDKMVPLGVMWGNDPSVNSPIDCNYLPSVDNCPTLSETWINPDAPLYSMETLGWGGRLSGPNDGAVDINAAIYQGEGDPAAPYPDRYAMSSCMSCHGPAEFESESFLLPVPPECADDACRPTVDKDGRVVYYKAGSTEFMQWFQNRPGDVPQDLDAIALDYDMNLAFKALPQWFKGTGQSGNLNFVEDFNDYRGISPDHLNE